MRSLRLPAEADFPDVFHEIELINILWSFPWCLQSCKTKTYLHKTKKDRPFQLLTYLTHKILKWFDQDLLLWMILIDLQKAVDKINHEVLLQKFKAIKFSEQSIQWSYLCHQIFLAGTENKLSDFGKIHFGFHLTTSSVFYLCQWYASSSKIKFPLVCW